MRRLGQRGWGKFTVEQLDVPRGEVRVTVRNSALAVTREIEGTACYMFEGWVEGALAFVRQAGDVPGDTPTVREVACAALGADRCEFETSV
jgi:predicted hydrocarbon binding protein